MSAFGRGLEPAKRLPIVRHAIGVRIRGKPQLELRVPVALTGVRTEIYQALFGRWRLGSDRILGLGASFRRSGNDSDINLFFFSKITISEVWTEAIDLWRWGIQRFAKNQESKGQHRNI